jgi:hypothetical protein
MERTIVKRTLQTGLMIGALAFLTPLAALAQTATPAAGELFAGLGLPQLTVTYTDTGVSIDQPEISAGRYLVHFVTESEDQNAAAGFVRLVEGKTLDDLSWADELAAGTPVPFAGPDPASFAWIYDTYMTGAGSADSPDVVVDLPAGDYGVWPDDPASTNPVAALKVTGDPATPVTGPEPQAVVTITEEGAGGQGFSFKVEGDLKAGRQVVKVVNNSDQPHFIAAGQYPEPITDEQLSTLFMGQPTGPGTPAPQPIDTSRITTAGYASTQSAGTTQWVEMSFTPGQLFMLCFVPDPAAGGKPHAFEGMVALVDVAP